MREDDIINDKNFVFLKSVIASPDIQIGDYTIYYHNKKQSGRFQKK